MAFQPSIPTGLVNLDVDYQNLQNNFAALDNVFGVDHTKFSNATAQKGYHTAIHLIPQAPPAATAGYGQIFSQSLNDGINTDTELFFLTGGNRLLQLTRNFVPVKNNNGYTFLPGGLIMQWGFSTAVTSSAGNTINYPIAFPNAIYNVSATVQTSDNSTIRFSILGNPTLTNFSTTQTSSSKFTRLYWTAIGS
jgi:hypothetical protein